jgi:hypothetical protein
VLNDKRDVEKKANRQKERHHQKVMYGMYRVTVRRTNVTNVSNKETERKGTIRI